MKLTYPNMGNLGIAIKSIFESMGFEVVQPPPVSKKSSNKGTRIAPEGACFPFKLAIGNVIEALEKGADTVVMLGGNGPCRFGYFGHLMREILEDTGFNARMIILEGDEVLGQLGSLRRTADISWARLARAIRLGWLKMKLADDMEKESHVVRPVEKIAGAASDTLSRCLVEIQEARSAYKLAGISQRYIIQFKQLKSGLRPRLRIGLVGDIYMLIEPFANHGLEEYLGRLGVEVSRSIYVSDWVKEHLGQTISKLNKDRLLSYAMPYLKDAVGGHGLDTIANIIRFGQQGFDGIIHVLPMTCMPEIVAQSVSPLVSRDKDIPVMTLVIDEHSGTAGLQSRLEAFVDILARRRALADHIKEVK